MKVEGRDKALDYFVLQRKDIVQLPIVALSPDLVARACVYQLNIDTHPVRCFARTALQYVFHSQFPAYFLYLCRLALVSEGGTAVDYEQARDSREICDKVVGNTVAEIFLLRIAA